MGFVASVPTIANALDPQVLSQNLGGETNLFRSQYRRDREQQFSVDYRSANDRQWTREGSHTDRCDAERAARRLERRDGSSQCRSQIFDDLVRNCRTIADAYALAMIRWGKLFITPTGH